MRYSDSWYEALSASNGTEQILESQLATYLRITNSKQSILLYPFEHLTPSEKRYLENCSTKSSIVLVNSDNLIKELPQASKGFNNETKRESPKKSLLRCDNLNQELAGLLNGQLR
ncbi:MAG: hypothetical protein Ct9H90mP27_0460 [Gammaproteobacteria bacterium]|nr:MAG: hypothetical protein Ct9H90mP27_0460 [Gammaproteobacteria bacterium]